MDVAAGSSEGKLKVDSGAVADYLGAFCGSLGFIFIFYPILGLMKSMLCIALLNALGKVPI